ncbi:MAG TPA: DUF2294 domain-containing protein [Deltaproteobacteria bacterium]|nr:DUF2294 domain-containing protein [Deltaproteobacteria bacterium]
MSKFTNHTRKSSGETRFPTKGQMEDEISKALISFEKEHMGRGPVEAKTYIIQDVVMIRLRGVLTPAERQLAKDEAGVQLIKQIRAKLLENSTEILKVLMSDITGCEVVSFHTDTSTKTGERFIIVTLADDLESKVSIRK